MGSIYGLLLGSRQYLVQINTNKNRLYNMVNAIPEMSTIIFMVVVQYSNQTALYLIILLTHDLSQVQY